MRRAISAVGRVIRNNTVLALVPLDELDEQASHQWAIRLAGQALPEFGSVVAVEGTFDGEVLRVSSWRTHAYRPHSDFLVDSHGVSNVIAERVLDGVPRQWPLMAAGESKTHTGGQVAFVNLFEADAQVARWVREQPKNSIVIFPFLRPPELPEVLRS